MGLNMTSNNSRKRTTYNIKKKNRTWNGDSNYDKYNLRCTHPYRKQGCCDICGEDLIGEQLYSASIS